MRAIDSLMKKLGLVKLDRYGLALTPEGRVMSMRPAVLDDGFGGRIVGWEDGDLAAAELEAWPAAARPRPAAPPPPVRTAPLAVAAPPMVARPAAPVVAGEREEDDWEWTIAIARARAAAEDTEQALTPPPATPTARSASARTTPIVNRGRAASATATPVSSRAASASATPVSSRAASASATPVSSHVASASSTPGSSRTASSCEVESSTRSSSARIARGTPAPFPAHEASTRSTVIPVPALRPASTSTSTVIPVPALRLAAAPPAAMPASASMAPRPKATLSAAGKREVPNTDFEDTVVTKAAPAPSEDTVPHLVLPLPSIKRLGRA
jgi:hypothetical protein